MQKSYERPQVARFAKKHLMGKKMKNTNPTNSEKTNDAAKIANFPLKITAIITAAGKSERAELNQNKVLYPLCGEKTALEICAEPFDENERITEIIFTSSREDFCEIEKIAKLIDLKTIISLIVIISYTIMVFKGIAEPDYKDLVIMVMTFYFASKTKKKESE